MFDVAILGGGPAGSAAAIALASAGRSVALIERTRYDNVRIGETLPPKARALFGQLGIWAQFEKAGHVAAPGIVSVWGSAQPYANDFITNPYGNGWHLDRRRFDRMLAAYAAACGATIHEPATVTACEPAGSGWRIELRAAADTQTIECRFVVDATGRRASPLKRRAGRRRLYDRMIGIAAFSALSTDGDLRTLIEATSDGWWYSTRLPDGGQVAVFMTDADIIDRGRGNLAGFMRRQLHVAPRTRERCGDIAAPPAPFAAMTCSYDQIHGGNWLLAGDAAATWDPLSGQGICKALESGMRAARAVDGVLEGRISVLDEYALWTQAQFDAYLLSRAKYYQAEQRWPAAPFWNRRHPVS